MSSAAFRPNISLTIAGSDPSGGAGIQADLKTFEAFGVYGASVLTLITAQNTQGVQAVELLSPSLIRAQLDSVFDDLAVNAVKIGALGGASVIEAVAEGLSRREGFPLVLDPVMISKHGDRLFDAQSEKLLVEKLFPKARLITPNRSEAAALLRKDGPLDDDAAAQAARELSQRHGVAILITGGAGDSEDVVDWYSDGEVAQRLAHSRIHGHHQHGAGCTLAAAITAGLASGSALETAIQNARAYVVRAMSAAPQVGHGEGPLWHQVDRQNSVTGCVSD